MISIFHLLCNIMRMRSCGISKQPKEACLNFAKLNHGNVVLWDIIFTPFKQIYRQKVFYIMRIYWGWWDEPAIRRGLPQVPKSGVEKIVLINEIEDWTLTQHIIIFVFPFLTNLGLAKACSICWLQFYYSCIEMWIKRWGKQCKEKCTKIKVPGAKKLCKIFIFRFQEQEQVEMVIFIIVTMMILMIIMMVVMMMIKMTMVTFFHFGNKRKYWPSSSP